MLAREAAMIEADGAVAGEDLVAKVETLARLYAAARAGFQRDEAEAGIARARLGEALTGALLAREQSEADARALALAGYRAAAAGHTRPRRRSRLDARLDKALEKLRSLGRALVIARSGLWDSEAGGLRAMAAYARRGPDPTVQPAALFDQAWYVAGRPDLAASRGCPLTHYLVHGAAEGASPHPLFDGAFYAQRNAADLARTGLGPLEHFVRLGAAQGRDPHPLFSLEHYVRQAPDLVASGANPLRHYLDQGWRRGLSPHPLFAHDFYVAQMAAAGAPEGPPLVHYIVSGSAAGLKPHPLFDPLWYGAEYPDVGESRLEPLSHYVIAGGAEGRHPGPWFDAQRYAALRGERLEPGRNLLVDYLQGGAWEIAEPAPGRVELDLLGALAKSAGMTPLEHWARREGT